MNKPIIISAIIIVISVYAFNLKSSTPSLSQNGEIQIGWQPPWINQGQIAVILQRSPILSENNISAKFIGFSFGPPMTEAALGGRLDILFAGDQPAFNLISKDPKWKILAPLVHYRSGILVPENSPIREIGDLKGKTIATGIGSTTYRDTMKMIEEEGLDPLNDIKIINLDVAEHLAFLEQGKGESWGEFDALATYDPTLTIAEHQGMVRVLRDYKSLGVVIVNNQFYEEHPKSAKRFLTAVDQSFSYYVNHRNQANEWYAQSARYSMPIELFDQMTLIEPKLQKEYTGTTTRFDNNTLEELRKNLAYSQDFGGIPNSPFYFIPGKLS